MCIREGAGETLPRRFSGVRRDRVNRNGTAIVSDADHEWILNGSWMGGMILTKPQPSRRQILRSEK